jgi:hypothetical protein
MIDPRPQGRVALVTGGNHGHRVQPVSISAAGPNFHGLRKAIRGGCTCYQVWAIEAEGRKVDVALRAVEVTGTIDEHQRLHLDEPSPVPGPSRVRMIILIPEQPDADEVQWLRGEAKSPSFDFLKEPSEDIYTLADGKPFDVTTSKPTYRAASPALGGGT